MEPLTISIYAVNTAPAGRSDRAGQRESNTMQETHRLTRRGFVRLGARSIGALAAGSLCPLRHALAQDAEVVQFKPGLTRPPDFAAFWKREREALPALDPAAYRLTPAPELSKDQGRVWDLKYPSAGGQSDVWGWYAAPAGASEAKKAAAVLTIPAFGGRRGPGPSRRFPGAAALVVGYRGGGDEPWPKDWITRGLDRPEDSVFRTHYLNLLRALRFLQGRPEVDPARIFLEGGSLGGAMTVVLAALAGREVAGLVASEPGMDYYFYADGRPAESSFKQMEQFVAASPDRKATILHVLGYYAPLNFAPDVTAPALFSCGGLDPLCFPKMVYAVYNHLGGRKEIRYYPEARHGSGPGLSDEWPAYSRAWLLKRMGAG
jgi:cephalosporin-C deacetylase